VLYYLQSQIAIVLDNVVYSAPGVSSGPITGGRSEITGNFDILEAKDLANVLRAGKLPASAEYGWCCIMVEQVCMRILL